MSMGTLDIHSCHNCAACSTHRAEVTPAIREPFRSYRAHAQHCGWCRAWIRCKKHAHCSDLYFSTRHLCIVICCRGTSKPYLPPSTARPTTAWAAPKNTGRAEQYQRLTSTHSASLHFRSALQHTTHIGGIAQYQRLPLPQPFMCAAILTFLCVDHAVVDTM